VAFATTTAAVAVFANESGDPSVYNTGIPTSYCGYDNAGNLFVNGISSNHIVLAELSRGASAFTPVSIVGHLGAPGQIQWDGSYLTYENIAEPGDRGGIARLSVSGSVATVKKTIPLNGPNRTTLSWIYDGHVIAAYAPRGGGARENKIGIWKYPKGGKRQNAFKFQNASTWGFQGVTISAEAPTK
jgi:hypothetical protein